MPRNIVLICLDTVRKDFFDEFAPRLQKKADISYQQARAASAWSVPSHASIFTGMLPHRHGIHTYNRDFSGLDESDTFLEGLTSHQSIGVSANVYAGSAFGFDSIFDEFTDISPTHRFSEGLDVRKFGFECDSEGLGYYADLFKEAYPHSHPIKSLGNEMLAKLYHLSRELPFPALLDDGAKVVSKAALRRVEQTNEPFFMFINYMDAHGPLQPIFDYNRDLYSVSAGWSSSDYDEWDVIESEDSRYLESYRDLYGAAIDYLDRKVVSMIEQVRTLTERETTFIITADHGENLGYPEDDGLLNHTSSLSEGLLHVPLIVVNPPGNYNTTEEGFVSHLNLGQLIHDVAEEVVPNVSRESIAAEVIGKTAGFEVRDNPDWWNRSIRCIYEGDVKFVWDSLGNEQYLPIRSEAQDGGGEILEESSQIKTAKHFEEPISASRECAVNSNAESKVSNETEARLEDLGYL